MDHAVPLSHDQDNQQNDLPHKAAGGDSVRENNNNSSSAAQVAEHYNQRRQLGVQGRMHTKITGLRLFNNWIKSIMIRKFAYTGCRVLDLGCGKGGDLRKWAIAGISEYIGMDIAQTSVLQAQKRFEEMRNTQFSAHFFAQDCYADPLENTMRPSDYQADVISAQFCLHYAFETEKKARQMMHNVSSHLADGGVFICTIPNANWLVKRLKANHDGTRSFGNTVYCVDFAEDASRIKRFGTAYAFTLDEAVEDCTEYLVHMPTFIELAKEHGLELEYCRDFHNLFADHTNDHSSVELLRRMRVVDNDRPEISADEWEAVGIYLAVAFRKKS
ncbi:guanine-N(7)-methyltransferase [Coemansia reversa NRRL 1564]|uniref:mRNA cap guanine-N(7) methyltransferase n=1 Tax=Coemansia reversa (strain ATCC 12441 / NRRL 1564) TaxID=763665 RepID=A0A2G5B4F2_COERN|nr:guanine-N(7)-methyltransferase [Coemansia reversa NRRL 1564]|eukprot:PIA13607.1 guanine-N(7)-methyltransferase [Coemansia reversa NRRL 1564]